MSACQWKERRVKAEILKAHTSETDQQARTDTSRTREDSHNGGNPRKAILQMGRKIIQR